MADDLDTVDAAQDAVEPDTPTPVESHPWGDDFDAERAWNTIQNLRGREKELERFERDYTRLTSDPDAYYEHGTRQGWVQLEDDTPDVESDVPDEDPRDRDVAELKAWKEQQEQAAALNAFNADLDKLASDAEVTLTKKQRNLIMVDALNGGWNQEATKTAFSEFVEDHKASEQAAIERYLASKRAPSPPRAGKQGEAEFDPTDRDARQNRMAAIIADAEADE